MLPKLFALAYLAVGTLATDGLFHSPKAESFLTVDFLANIPLNVTTPDGTVATVPIRGGEVKGKSFNGRVVENITSATESTLTSTNKWEYTAFESRLLFENDDGGRILINVVGTVTYANEALHGFGYATLKTGINELQSINYGMYVAEWQGYYNTGTAQIQIFEITTGGRVDGKPIDALEPPKVPGECS